jgi:hypothetical protein
MRERGRCSERVSSKSSKLRAKAVSLDRPTVVRPLLRVLSAHSHRRILFSLPYLHSPSARRQRPLAFFCLAFSTWSAVTPALHPPARSLALSHAVLSPCL